jgi:cyclic beta-1,2-glucan synthetase
MDNVDEPRHSLSSDRVDELLQRHDACTARKNAKNASIPVQKLQDTVKQILRLCHEPALVHDRVANWILDNDYQLERAVRQIEKDLPESFYQNLPSIILDENTALPRILDIAHAILGESQLQLTQSFIVQSIHSYQEHSYLLHGELWALPAMLRLACMTVLIQKFKQLEPQLPEVSIPSPAGTTQITDPTECIARVIASLVVLNSIEWPAIVDQLSAIESVLSTDPDSAYAQMNFYTRERYRKAVESLARLAKQSELTVAKQAIGLATNSQKNTRQKHVGYWLIDDGYTELETHLGCRVKRFRLSRFSRAHARALYAACLILTTLLALGLPYWYLGRSGASHWQQWLCMILMLIPASVLSITVVHWLVPKLTRPQVLPAFDFKKTIPIEYRCAVAVPVILKDVEGAKSALQKLELLWLANSDPSLSFVLLSDPADADVHKLAQDDDIECTLRIGIEKLNSLHTQGTGPFSLLHRHRKFNPTEACWMAWERKRGKLEMFNEFLLDANVSRFEVTAGRVDSLPGTPYVITLDADTLLPPGAAAELIGTLAHPLNKASVDPRTKRVEKGYTVLQPRVELIQDAGEHSQFAKLYAGDSAIDIYSRAVSDVHQDLFDTGMYVGKGIYDVVAFQQCVAQRLPDNRILSHDLIEGIHGRVALVSNIVLYEQFPDTYPEYALRQHRWIRGDWQLLPWLMNRVPIAGGRVDFNPLSLLDKWKLADNLRRSIVSPVLLLLLILGWLVLPGSALIWTVLSIAILGSYLLNDVWRGIYQGMTLKLSTGVVYSLKQQTGRWCLSIVFLVNDSYVAMDAIVRTLWRSHISHRAMLEWRSAAHAKDAIEEQSLHRVHWYSMWPASAFSILLGVVLYLFERQALWAAAPVLLLWAAAPEIAYRLGQSREFRLESLTVEDRGLLLDIARRTWHYFDTFTRPQDHWLPPDNFQEEPKGVIAHRTSPTNIGLYLVSTLTARDLGFLGTCELSVRCRNTLDAMDTLEMYQGHLLNWYDTSTLEPLEPKYVSTVDNGNLAISLLAVKHGCLEYASKPIIDQNLGTGLETSLRLLISGIKSEDLVLEPGFQSTLNLVEVAVYRLKFMDSSWLSQWNELTRSNWPALQQFISDLLASDAVSLTALGEFHTWYERFNHQLQVVQRDLDLFFPWLAIAYEVEGESDEVPIVSSEWMFLPIPKLLSCCESGLAEIKELQTANGSTERLISLESVLCNGIHEVQQLQCELLSCSQRANSMAYAMNFDLLYDADSHLFRIGYNVSAERFDHNTYDLLASEARLASYFAIAKHDVPIEHWSYLGRPVTQVGRQPVLLSWSGSMFEYLMPALFLPGKRDTLLGESEKLAVISQRRYAQERDVPWGISESAFGALDADNNYQYRAFGAPGLGLRRGLSRDLVIAPYASALALCVMPESAVDNMRHLIKLDARGSYGFIDALDFTANRLTSSGSHQAVKTYMAHHQGMTLAAIVNALKSDVLVERVLREKPLRTIEMLLQERIPWDAPIESGRADERIELQEPDRVIGGLPSWMPRPGSDVPQIQLLGNGNLSSWISASGGGALFHGKTALTRWSNYLTASPGGQYLYLDVDESHDAQLLTQGSICSFAPHRVEQQRRFHEVMVRQSITVASGEDVEIRSIKLSNEGAKVRRITLTSYAEVCLAPTVEDQRHPAFSKLFVHSRHIPEYNGLLFVRRSRDTDNQSPVLLHQAVFDDPDIKLSGFETDRKVFLGRLGSLDDPLGLRQELTGSVGWTQDAVMALQVQVTIQPGARKQLAFLTMAAASRRAVLDIAARYPSPDLDWVVQDANIEESHEIGQLEIDPARLSEMQVLVSALLYPVSSLRVHHGDAAVSQGNQTALWQFGISGDIPILLLTMANEETSGTLEYLIRAQHLWRRKGFNFDLVVLRKDSSGYEEPLREQILSILRDLNVFGYLGRKGGIHLLSSDHLDPSVRQTIESLATVVLQDVGRSLSQQIDCLWHTRSLPPHFDPIRGPDYSAISELKRPSNLMFDNGFGGFDPHTGDYVIHLESGMSTPAPWCNVIANEIFGTVVSESGLGFSWLINSGEFRLTPWANDPVADIPAEVLYLRDETNGDCWSVTPAPLAYGHAVQVKHGPGFTQWSQHSHGLEQTLEVCVPKDDPVKLLRLQLSNPSATSRRITATYYVDWCLGSVVSQARPHVCASYDSDLHAIFANNGWNAEFSECVAFVSATSPPHSVSGDRSEFLGPLRDVKRPQGLERWDLGGHFSPVADACAAYQLHIDIAPGAVEEVIFMLGAAGNLAEATALLKRLQTNEDCSALIESAEAGWQEHCDTLQVKTPDPAFDLMVNRWLPYQALSCRIFARAGYYQASGAHGFRDQLQDVLSLIGREPQRVRTQIIEAAAHQFELGDALHWWHPPAGRGVRTRCSDDFLWLVYVTARYIKGSGDVGVLDVEVPFLHAPALQAEEHDRYALFETGEIGTVYAHCCRALQYMQRLGVHGLPLIGDGDWNDGMNRVGDRGQGESVWLVWFQIQTINLFSPIALLRGDSELATHLQLYRDELKVSVESHAWDGEWYMRAFDDDGVPWGSSTNDECRIDSLVQSWAVLSGAADKNRAGTAMDSATKHLLDSEKRLVRLLAPPFDITPRDPGYIKAYPPGVRENGGQYTHAATWFGLAAAALGDGDKALKVFDIISPIRRTLNKSDAIHYAREPYVLPGDVSGSVNDPGRGGWSWYTGSASWAWQLAVHGILGIDYVPGGVVVKPCLPAQWDHVEVTVRHGTASIAVRIETSEAIDDGATDTTVDGVPFLDHEITYPMTNTVKRVVVRVYRPAGDPISPQDRVL